MPSLRLDWRRHHRKMKSHGNGKQAKTNLSSKSRGTLTGSGLDLETKSFSASGRGRTFFLTSLFIELIEPREGLQISRLRSDDGLSESQVTKSRLHSTDLDSGCSNLTWSRLYRIFNADESGILRRERYHLKFLVSLRGQREFLLLQRRI